VENLSIKSIIQESKKIRAERGEDFFENKKTRVVEECVTTSKIHNPQQEKDYKSMRETHLKLAGFISDYDKKNFDQNDQVIAPKKKRSKSIHLYIDETIEHFLTTESKNAEAKWGLRKNAGFGQLIQKFILNFIQLKKREERQLKRVKKLIDDFRSNLVDFKLLSRNVNDYIKAEEINQKMKIISNDLRILLSLLEFEDKDLKHSLGQEIFPWVNFIVQWKYQS
jgi:hypothetical protein